MNHLMHGQAMAFFNGEYSSESIQQVVNFENSESKAVSILLKSLGWLQFLWVAQFG